MITEVSKLPTLKYSRAICKAESSVTEHLELHISQIIRVIKPALCTLYLQFIQSLYLYMFRAH
jgi:hypothetical protein